MRYNTFVEKIKKLQVIAETMSWQAEDIQISIFGEHGRPARIVFENVVLGVKIEG